MQQGISKIENTLQANSTPEHTFEGEENWGGGVREGNGCIG